LSKALVAFFRQLKSRIDLNLLF